MVKKTKPEDSKWQALVSWLKRTLVVVVIVGFLITILVSCFFQSNVIVWGFNYYCVSPIEGNTGEEIVYEAINLNHQVKENKNSKERLLSLLDDNVKWYSRKPRDKNKLTIGSNFDCFCFSTRPKYDEEDAKNNNYQLRINGFHRYRKPDKQLVKLESLYAEIKEGKIVDIHINPLDEFEGKEPQNLNFLYNHFSIIVFLIIVIISIVLAIIVKNIPWVNNLIKPWLEKLIKSFWPFGG